MHEVLLGLFLVTATATVTVTVPDLRAEVVSGQAGARLDFFLSGLAQAGFSGTVLVAMDREIVLHKGYGLADRTRKVACRPDTIFDIGSITKQFTAAAILKLELGGKLSTTDTLAKHFPEVAADKAGITLHQLLTHTSGLDHGYGEDTDYAPRDLALQVFFKMPLLTAPGAKYRYSNPGYSILAASVEKVSGMPYERYLSEHLLRPAGMTETGYILPKWDMGRMTRNYNGEKDNGFTFNRSWGPDGPYWHCFGNGCILTTSGDLYRWEQALQSNAVLSPEARRKLWTPHVPVGESSSYAYGWRVGKSERGTTWIGHGGGSDFGVWATHFRFPEERLLVIVLSNQASLPGAGPDDQSSFVDRLATLALAR